jgi:ABC-type glutathione transport system ATPase component
MLSAESLSISVGTPGGKKELLHDISFSAPEGQITAILGESGSGKTTLLRGLTNLFPEGSDFQRNGKVLFGGTDLLTLDAGAMAGMRKSRIRYVFQEPAQAFNPVLRMQTQLKLLRGDSPPGALTDHLRELGITEIDRITRSYPHVLSVGTLQRIQLALALAGAPELLICDEPTSAVDATSRRKILDTLSARARAGGVTVILSTHDLGIARAYATSVNILYAGTFVEQGPAMTVLGNPVHPYTLKLTGSRPARAPEDIS